MIDILILDGTCGHGPGSYQDGLFHMPDGSLRGAEDLQDLTISSASEAPPRRQGIARGLRDALTATGPLPRPLGFAASVVGFGLDVLGGDERAWLRLELHFTDGAVAWIRTDAAGAARIEGDREVVRLALQRQAVGRLIDAELPPRQSPVESASEAPEPQGPDQPDLASIFTYEKRGGRLRRLAAKALEAPDETRMLDASKALGAPER